MGGGGHGFERLFSPIQVGPMLVPNRICETTNTIGAGRLDGLPDEPFVAHHLAKAQGGTGWIGSETWLLNSPIPAEAADEFFPGAASTRMPLYAMPGFVERTGAFFQAVHEAGAVAVSQLTHVSYTFGASAVALAEAYDWVPHALDDDEIEMLLGTYVMAASALQAAGTDGLEVHCAHEALPQLFLSPATNQRSDRWGGDALRRTAFVREILARVRAAVGDGVALGIRIGGWETRQGGYSLLEMREMLSHIAETGLLDFVDVDMGSSHGVPSYVPPSYWGHGQFREVGRAVKADVDVPVLFSGRVNDPVVAEELLAQQACDLVGMTRAGIADPEFPAKTREGRLGEIRRCIACNRCIGETVQSYVPIFLKKPTCSVNPLVGNELLWKAQYRPASTRRRVVVVGGGAAGLEAARVAAMRGHEVVVLEQGPALGGQVRLAAKAPGRDSFEDLVIYQQTQMETLGVDVRLSSRAGADDVLALEPDVVVCATGSVPIRPDVPGADAPHVVQGWDVLEGRAAVGERVAVVSQEDHMETPSVADLLASEGRQVEILHHWTAVGREVDRYTLGTVMCRLEEGGVRIRPGLLLTAVDGDRLELVSPWTRATRVLDGFDTVVLVYGSAPDTALHDELKRRLAGKGPRLFLVGSAWVPRRLAEATQHGMKVGLEV
ncbi:MAG: FAD-dependent oxidoreductase [Acidimicrobiia bacterium]|nr:FAD-dependent oxidoreductase [Acidimicrobiia bacterium]